MFRAAACRVKPHGMQKRIQRSRAEQRKILRAWQKSNRSAVEFGKHHGISASALWSWQRREKQSGQTEFVEVKVRDEIALSGEPRYELVLKNGRRLLFCSKSDRRECLRVGKLSGWLMLTLPTKVRVFVAVNPVDMRKQFDGLAKVVREALDADPETGHLYVFANRRRHLLKILFFDQQGYCILAKRLESGTFPIPKQDQEHDRDQSRGFGETSSRKNNRNQEFRKGENVGHA